MSSNYLTTAQPKASQKFKYLIVSVLIKKYGLFFSIFWKIFQFVKKRIAFFYARARAAGDYVPVRRLPHCVCNDRNSCYFQ
jgi:hypothetical protein